MAEVALQEQLSSIKRRQYLILVLLIIPYLVGLAELIGYAAAGVLYAGVGVLGYVAVALHSRRTRSSTGQ